MRFVLTGSFLLALLLSGCTDSLTHIRLDTTSEPAWRPLGASPTPVARADLKPPPTEAPVHQVEIRGAFVAVFDIEDKNKRLSSSEVDGLTDYLATKIAENGLFHVIPRSEIKKRLLEQKQDSYRQCYDQSCQIDIGREIAAQKTLNVVISAIGSSCVVTAALCYQM